MDKVLRSRRNLSGSKPRAYLNILLFAFAVIYTMALSAVDLLAENSVKVALAGIATVALLLVDKSLSEKSG